MKLNVATLTRKSGSVLLVTLVTAGVLGITLASYLTLVSNQSRNVARSKHWNQALVVAESGVEDALQMVNKFVATPLLTNWVNTYSGDNWSKSGNVYSRTGYLNAAHTIYYTVTVSNQNTTLNNLVTIRSTGYTSLPASLANNTVLTRTVVVRAQIDTIFNVAMAALGAIDLKGNGISTDSFDSGDTNWSTASLYDATRQTSILYDPTRRKAGGDVATNNTLTNSNLSVGNADVAGHIITGPSGTYSIGPNGTVGDIAWVTTTKGIKPGWAKNDMNVVFNNVTLPSNASWQNTGVSGSGMGGNGTAPDGLSYDHIFTNPGDYIVSDSGTIYVGTNVHVRLHSTVNNFKPNKIYVAGTGAASGKMTTYLAGTSATLYTEHVTQSGKAANMVFMGLPSLTSISYNGNGDFTGSIYAPQADFQLNGGGSSTWDFIGASVTKLVQMNGHYHFHYDEDLRRNGPNNGYIANDWREL
jgi:hypothetical protein